MTNILLIDDDKELNLLLCEYLETQSFNVESAFNGKEGLSKATNNSYDLIIVDIMMPKMNGIDLLKSLRNDKDMTPIVMLTAKGEDIDKILGLELGADDYVTKPCNPRELTARITSILRRKKQFDSIQKDKQKAIQIEIAPNTRMCFIKGEALELTAVEFDILYILYKSAGEIVNKELLFQDVLGRNPAPFDRSIDVHISRIRKKLKDNNGPSIITVRTKGYQLSN